MRNSPYPTASPQNIVFTPFYLLRERLYLTTLSSKIFSGKNKFWQKATDLCLYKVGDNSHISQLTKIGRSLYRKMICLLSKVSLRFCLILTFIFFQLLFMMFKNKIQTKHCIYQWLNICQQVRYLSIFMNLII